MRKSSELFLLFTVALFSLAACKEKQGQDVYKRSEIGVSRAIEYGTIIGVREVEILPDSNDVGTLLGAGVGAGGGSYVGDGSGNAWAAAGGAVLGAVVGNAVQNEIGRSNGNEYIISLLNGDAKTIVMENKEGDVVFKTGDKIMIQYCDAGEHNKKCTAGGEFQRLLPIDKFPESALQSVHKTKKRKHSK